MQASNNKNLLMSANHINVEIDARPILKDVNFELRENDWLMIVGPNGAGKSTLVRAIARNLEYSGKISFGEINIQDFTSVEYAKRVGFLSQQNAVGFDFKVSEIVELGRYCHKKRKGIGIPQALSDKDCKIIEAAKNACGLQDFYNKPISKISGGELQRTFLAQTLAQDPDIMVLDEPTNHLDIKFQEEIFSIVDKWRKKPGRAIISVVHDLTLAKKYGSSALLITDGKQVDFGSTDAVMCTENLSAAYGLDVESYMNSLLSVWK